MRVIYLSSSYFLLVIGVDTVVDGRAPKIAILKFSSHEIEPKDSKHEPKNN